MAIIRFKLKDVKEGEWTSEWNGLLAEIVRRKYVIEWWAHTDTHRTSPIDILQDAITPKVGDTVAYWTNADLFATAVSVVAERTRHPRIWVVKATYDTDRLVQGIVNNPLNQPKDISYGTNLIERPLVRDLTGLLVRNSAGEPYDPPLMWSEKRATVTIVENLASFDAIQASSYEGSVNSDVVTGLGGTWPPYTVRCLSRTGHKQLSFGQTYYQVSTQIELRGQTYAEWVLDQGFRYVVNNPLDRRKPLQRLLIRDPVDFSLPGNPTLLNGRGRPIWEAVASTRNALAFNTTVITLDEGLIGVVNFPPGPTLVGGVYQSPHWNFFIKMESEIMQVVAVNTPGVGQFTVARGVGGTTAVAHAAKTQFTLEPYFMFYYPYPALPFAALSLPAF